MDDRGRRDAIDAERGGDMAAAWAGGREAGGGVTAAEGGRYWAAGAAAPPVPGGRPGGTQGAMDDRGRRDAIDAERGCDMAAAWAGREAGGGVTAEGGRYWAAGAAAPPAAGGCVGPRDIGWRTI